MKIEQVSGITYSHPVVTLLHATPLVNAELAGRVCYDSFGSSEHEQVRNFKGAPTEDIESSELMDQLCHVYFHNSVIEHLNLTFNISGTSRAVLQEEARHRIQSLSVRSTRYTMSSIINAFVASQFAVQPRIWFADKIASFNMFVIPDDVYTRIECDCIYSKLYHQRNLIGEEEFNSIAIAKSSLNVITNPVKQPKTQIEDSIFSILEAGKKKRNVGDNFKHIVTDNWKVDMVVTFNLRSLKNFFTLRDSNSAYFQTQWLAQAMKEATPSKYLDLIVKKESKCLK